MSHSRLLLALGAIAWFANGLEASINSLTVQDNANGDYPTLVRNDGTLLDAINFGHSGANVVINGIAFVSAPGNSPAGANWNATGTDTNDGLANSGIDDLFFSELSASGTITLTYTNLDPARVYLVQIFHGEPRDCCGTTYSGNSLSTNVDSAERVPPITIGNGVNGEDPPAASDLAIVTAELTGVTSFTYFARIGPGRDSAISGFQVREGSGPPPATGDTPFISEFVAIGNDSHQDEDGETPDWIEIYNPTGADLDLTGYHLTDEAADLSKWKFPSTLLQAENYLVVFASSKDRDTAGSELHTTFRLTSAGEYLALVAPDGTTVLSEFSPTYPRQEAGFSHGVGGLAPDGPTGYFATTTPGSGNGILLTAPLLAPVINPDCGSFTSSIQATISSNFPGGQIRYTTNGAEPSARSPLYTVPISFSTTTHLRARVFDPGTGDSGEIASVHFQKLSTASGGGLRSPASFNSTLPIIVIENFGAGGIPSPGSNYQTARIAVHEIDPATGRSTLTRPPDACFRIGIRRRGQSSSGFAKPQYRVELRDDNNVDTDYPLLGLPEESDWVFNGPWTDKALIRNPLAFELGRTIGIQAPRTAHFEMFLSTNGGTLAATEYVGVYVLLEKIKDGRNRTDLANLEPTHSTTPEVTGGYMLRFEPPGIANDGPRAFNWTSVEIIEPKTPTLAQERWIGRYLDQFVRTIGWRRGQGANNSGVPNSNPVTGYPAYIDVDSFVSLFIVNELLREQDSYVRSDYMFKDRLGKLHKGPLWDYNLIAGTGCCFDNRNTQGWQYLHDYNRGGRDHSYEPDWFVPLMRSPDFKQQVIDRWAELRKDGVLEVSNLFDVIDSLADPLARAAVRNFTKWNILGSGSVGFPTPATNNWQQQIEFMKNWLVQRMGWIDSQFPGGVTIGSDSGVVVAGTDVPLNTPNGVIYYTTDGTDPRLPGGGISGSALSLGGGGQVPINSTLDLIARSRSGTQWSAPSSATYVVGTAADASNLAVSELNYHPSDPTAAEVLADPTYRDDDFEYIEFKNMGLTEIDLSGASLVEGIAFTIPAPAVIQPGGYALLVENLAAFEERYGPGLPVLGVYANKMNNDGDTLRMLDLNGNDIFHFTFNDIWYRPTDGEGYSLVAADESSLPGNYDDPASWGISCQLLGNPGAANGAVLSQSFGGWKNYHFSTAEIADPLVSGSYADPDLDGIVTLMEYALGLDPRGRNLSGLPAGTIVDDAGTSYLALTFQRFQKALDLTYHLEVSPDLLTWTESPTLIDLIIDNGDGTETVTIRDSVPIGPLNAQRFIRLVVGIQ